MEPVDGGAADRAAGPHRPPHPGRDRLFPPESGIGADVVRLFERIGVFGEPIAGLEPQLAQIERGLEAIALTPDPSLSEAAIDRLTAGVRVARTRIHEAAYQQLHRDPYRADLGPSILAAIPPGLDGLMEQVVVNAAMRLGFRVEPVRGPRAYAIDFGNEAHIDSLPGVPGGSSFVGSFDCEYAVEDETIDFFASGHALVEGLLAHFDEDPKGRVARLEVRIPGEPGVGVIAIYKDGPTFEVLAFDADGRVRQGWADAFRRGSVAAHRMSPESVAAHDWRTIVTRVAALAGGRPHAIAAVVVRDAPGITA